MCAFLASFSTVSQPDSTTGEKAITSTFCWMKVRIALIWFSCFCCASENLSWIPAFFAASWTDLVLAVRQPLSAPTWAKPMVIAPPEPPLVLADGPGAGPPEGASVEQAVSAEEARSAAAARRRAALRAMRESFGSDAAGEACREEGGAVRKEEPSHCER